MKTPSLSFPSSIQTLSSLAFLAFAGGAQAANRYWDGGGSPQAWGTNANWSDTSTASVTGLAFTNGDNVFFNTSDLATSVSYLNSDRVVNSLTILGTATGSVTIRAKTISTADHILTVNGGGVTVNSGAGHFAFQDNTGVNADGSAHAADSRKLTITLGASQTWAVNNVAGMTSYSVVAGAAGIDLTKTGSGTLTLANSANTYAGKTIINGGVVSISGTGSLGANPGSFVADQVTLNGGTLKATANSNFTIAQATRGFTLGAGGGTFAPDAGVQIAIDGAITGAGALIVDGPGTLLLRSTANDYSGNTFVRQGTLKSGTPSGSPADRLPSATVLTLGNSSNSGTFDLNSQIQTLGGLTTSGSGTDNKVINNGASKALTIHNSADYTYNGTIGGGGSGNSIDLIKSNGGTMTLGGTNTFSGSTSVNGGKLTISSAGSINGTSGVSIDAGEFNYNASTTLTAAVTFSGTGGKLSGTGTIGPAVNVTAGNFLAAGNSIGTLLFASDLTVAGTYLYELNSTLATADLADVSGSLTLSGVLDLIQLGTYTDGQKFTLFAYDGAFSGSLMDTSLANIADDATFTGGGGLWLMNYNDATAGLNGGFSASNTYVTITAVPEPNTFMLLGSLGLLALVRCRSR